MEVPERRSRGDKSSKRRDGFADSNRSSCGISERIDPAVVSPIPGIDVKRSRLRLRSG